MASEVWYRKWRPQRFAEVAGQEHITRTLANAVVARRVAHAYLFCGPRGTGKTTTARLLAKAINCEQNVGGEPCNHCASCRGVAEGRALDLIEMDAASNRGIDEIRNLRDKVGYSPTSSAYKVYLLDEAHELTQHAFDALLKTLEEPPPHVIFVLATTEAERVPATILSRCQRHDFRRIRIVDAVHRMREICEGEQVHLPEGALDLIARRATGSLRDGINLLEQVVASSGPQPTLAEVREALGLGGDGHALALVQQAVAGELAPALESIARARDEGVEMRQLQRSVMNQLRALLLIKAGAEMTLELGEESLAQLRQVAEHVQPESVLRLLRLVSAIDFRTDVLASLPLELALAEAILMPGGPGDSQPPQAAVDATGAAQAQGPLIRPDQRQTRRPATRTVPEVLRAGPAPGVAHAPAVSAETPSEHIPPSTLATELPPSSPPPHDGGAESPGSKAPAGNGTGEPAASTPESPTERQMKPADEAAAPAMPLSVEWVQAQMPAVYARLREQRSRAGPFINSECNIIEIHDGAARLVFKHDFLAAKLLSEENGRLVKEVESALESVCGSRYRIDVSVDPDVSSWRHPPVTSKTSHLLDEAEKLGLKRIERPRTD